MYPHLNNLINDKDPTGYVDLKFIGKQGETMWDKRFGPESYFAEFFVFSVNFKHSDEIKLYVNSEFKSHEKVAEIALKFSKMIGSVPIFLRKHLKWVFIHGPWEDKSKCTCMWYAARNYGIVI